jgi:type IV secretory pathway protease TraF
VVFLALAACGVAYHSSGIVFNHTGSMPIGFYQVRHVAAEAPVELAGC